MKKGLIIIAFVLSLMVFIVSVRNVNLKKNYLKDTEIIGVYINNELSEKIPLKGEAKFYKAICDDENVSVSWDSESWGLLLKNLTKKVKCNLYFYSGQTVFNFDYTGSEQIFIAPVSGTYRLETWGAQGGNTNTDFGGITTSRIGGAGGYSSGYFNLNIGNELYVYVGQGGTSTKEASINLIENCSSPETFNGGGSAFIANCVDSAGSGGGATHIATKSGLLSTLENSKKDIIIVSSGGGGSYSFYAVAADGGSGGGFNGNLPPNLNNGGICGWDRVLTFGNKSTQFSGGTTTGCEVSGQTAAKFGIGESTIGPNNFGSGGGGGYYGGGAGRTAYGAGGGSSYIGNPLLKEKVMYCYNCEESNEESTKTISTTCNEETPTSYCAKKGNGYARITLVSID